MGWHKRASKQKRPQWEAEPTAVRVEGRMPRSRRALPEREGNPLFWPRSLCFRIAPSSEQGAGRDLCPATSAPDTAATPLTSWCIPFYIAVQMHACLMSPKCNLTHAVDSGTLFKNTPLAFLAFPLSPENQCGQMGACGHVRDTPICMSLHFCFSHDQRFSSLGACQPGWLCLLPPPSGGH